MKIALKKQAILGGSVAVAIVALIAAYFIIDQKSLVIPGITPAADNGASSEENPGYTLEQVPLEGEGLPSRTRAVIFSDGIPEEVRTLITKKVSDLQARLTTTPTDASAWFELGVLYHTANDYDGAREVWEFLTIAAPNDPVAFENLGKLYHFTLKDFPKAEEYLKKALALDTARTNPYIELATLYQYSYKQNTNALPDLLKKGIAAFPGNTDFLVMYGDYYLAKGDTANARAQYQKALDAARDAGNLSLVAALGQKLSTIK